MKRPIKLRDFYFGPVSLLTIGPVKSKDKREELVEFEEDCCFDDLFDHQVGNYGVNKSHATQNINF